VDGSDVMTQPYDLCWLDCDNDGFLVVQDGMEICLCPMHHQMRRAGDLMWVWPWRVVSKTSVA